MQSRILDHSHGSRGCCPHCVGVALVVWVPRKLGWWSAVPLVCWTCSSYCVVGFPQWSGFEQQYYVPQRTLWDYGPLSPILEDMLLSCYFATGDR